MSSTDAQNGLDFHFELEPIECKITYLLYISTLYILELDSFVVKSAKISAIFLCPGLWK